MLLAAPQLSWPEALPSPLELLLSQVAAVPLLPLPALDVMPNCCPPKLPLQPP